MSNRYWVGDSGNISDTAHWSTSSNGAGGASVPTNADKVFFDANSVKSTGKTITFDVNLSCAGFVCTGLTNAPTFNNSAAKYMVCYEHFTLVSGITWPTITVYLYGTGTITTNGITLTGNFTVGSGVSVVTMGDHLTMTGNLTFNSGTWNLNNKNVTCNNFSSPYNETRVFTMGSGTFTCNGNFSWSQTSNCTINKNTSKIIMTNSFGNFLGGGFTYNNLECTGNIILIMDSNTFSDLKGTAGKIIMVSAGVILTISSLSGEGTYLSKISLRSESSINHFHLTCTGNNTVNHWEIRYCVADGGGTFKAYWSTNTGGNSGWDFTNPVDRYFVSYSGGSTSDGSKWSATSGGAPCGYPPTLSTENAYFDSNSMTQSSGTIQFYNGFTCNNLIISNVPANTNFSSTNLVNIYCYGSFSMGNGFYDDLGAIVHFKAMTTGKTITMSSYVAYYMYFDGVGGEWTLQDNLNAGIIDLLNGSIVTNNKLVNLSSSFFACDSTATRSITMGSTVLTCNYFDCSPSTGFTFGKGTSTIKFVMDGGNSPYCFLNGLTYNKIEIDVGVDNIVLYEGFTAADLKVYPEAVIYVDASYEVNPTVTLTTLTGNGTLGNLIRFALEDNNGSDWTDGRHFHLSLGSKHTLDYYAFKCCDGKNSIHANNTSINEGYNTGIEWDVIGASPIITAVASILTPVILAVKNTSAVAPIITATASVLTPTTGVSVRPLAISAIASVLTPTAFTDKIQDDEFVISSIVENDISFLYFAPATNIMVPSMGIIVSLLIDQVNPEGFADIIAPILNVSVSLLVDQVDNNTDIQSVIMSENINIISPSITNMDLVPVTVMSVTIDIVNPAIIVTGHISAPILTDDIRLFSPSLIVVGHVDAAIIPVNVSIAKPHIVNTNSKILSIEVSMIPPSVKVYKYIPVTIIEESIRIVPPVVTLQSPRVHATVTSCDISIVKPSILVTGHVDAKVLAENISLTKPIIPDIISSMMRVNVSIELPSIVVVSHLNAVIISENIRMIKPIIPDIIGPIIRINASMIKPSIIVTGHIDAEILSESIRITPSRIFVTGHVDAEVLSENITMIKPALEYELLPQELEITRVESYISRFKDIKIKQYDSGIFILILHDLTENVYSVKRGDVEEKLINNLFVHLDSADTITLGLHEILFITKDDTSRITSSTKLEYTIMEGVISHNKIAYSLKFVTEYSSRDTVQIKKDDFGVRINVLHNSTNDVYYCVDDGNETKLTENRYLLLSASDTSDLGNHTIIFYTKYTNSRDTVSTDFLYTVY